MLDISLFCEDEDVDNERLAICLRAIFLPPFLFLSLFFSLALREERLVVRVEVGVVRGAYKL